MHRIVRYPRPVLVIRIPSSDLEIAHSPIKMSDTSRDVRDVSSGAGRTSVSVRDPGEEARSYSSLPAACFSESRKRKLRTTPGLAESDQDPPTHSTQRPPKRQRCSLAAEQFGQLSCNDQDPIPANSHHCASPKQSAASQTKENLLQSEALNSRFGKSDEMTYEGASALTCETNSPSKSDQTVSVLPAESSDSDLDEDYIRCICGAKEEDHFLAMICCDGCTAWQHNVCVSRKHGRPYLDVLSVVLSILIY